MPAFNEATVILESVVSLLAQRYSPERNLYAYATDRVRLAIESGASLRRLASGWAREAARLCWQR